MGLPHIKILLLEDNPLDTRLLQLFLGECRSFHFEITHVERLNDGLDKLSRHDYNLILSDLSLPDSHDLETFKRLHESHPEIPIIVLSGSDDENLAIQAVREGAQDYLVKGNVDANGLVRSISYAIERHRADLAIQESEQHYRRLLQSITDYSYRVRLENGKPSRSEHGPGCLAVTGYEAKDLEGAPELWYKIVHADDRPALLGQVSRVLRGETPPPIEHRIIHKDSSQMWVRHSVVPSRNETGTMVSFDGLISDITARKQAEEKLVNSEAFYHSLVENLPQNIFRKDLNERFMFANQRFCVLLGKQLDEIIGKTDLDFYTKELAAKFQKDDRWVIESGRIFESVEENVSPTGDKIYVQVVKTPIYDANGTILGTQCIFWDITERKRFEERLQSANEELAKREVELRRTNEALRNAQMQLIQAEKMESIGTLAAGVAHEVKNPLAILLMGTNYLTNKLAQSDENIVTVLKEMQEAIERADSIARGLMDFSATHQLDIKPHDLNDVIKDTLRMLRHAINLSNVDLVEDWGSNLPKVGMDKRQIQQVFVNIFMNSIHAMAEQGGVITIRTYRKEITKTTFTEGSRKGDHIWQGDTAIVAEVEDNGPGISEEHLIKIFDPFFTTKPTGEGTGLGLSVSRKIIELHRGILEIKNKPERGVQVTITLKEHLQ